MLIPFREESARHGTRRRAVAGLAATGGAIAPAGLILAGTFAVLGALVARSVLVTAATLEPGHRVWGSGAWCRPAPPSVRGKEPAGQRWTPERGGARRRIRRRAPSPGGCQKQRVKPYLMLRQDTRP
ncbi:hypothetical protein [Kitasatospora purpeofusca]|uniref:hypothetical protein n=1 Tax=Kitasatospora purpeofusca TaxID=67352 RepID=UPI002E2BEF18|nr:hypothetical protein [Kitasatospora purpeofusca]